MKSIIYVHISTISFSALIVIFWTINKKIILNQISGINYDGIFIYYHKNFKRDIFYYKDYLWKRPIEYFVEKDYMKNNVKKAILDIQNNTCITFKERDKTFNDTQGLIFVEGQSCLSFYGLQNPNYSQYIWLSSKCYINAYIILHEIGHALGLMHEHARIGRDKFIDIDFSQLDKHGRDNFIIRNDTRYYRNYSTAYDYASIMHYDRYEFGSFWKWLFGIPVMKSRLYEQYTWMMGQHEKATFNDYKQINLVHCNWCGYADNKTGHINNESAKCKNSGYPDFRNCSRCICPTGYTGDSCEKVIDSDSKCNETIFYANETRVPLLFAYKMDCYIQIKPKNETFTNVQISISYFNAPYYKGDICVESNAFQIKYRRDRGATGLLLCGHDQRNLTITSESKNILIIYKGIDNHSFLAFNYRGIKKTKT